MTDSNDQDAIVVSGTAPTSWGYNIDMTDRGTGETERRWIDDRNETVNMPKYGGQIIDSYVAPDATLTLNAGHGGDFIMPRVEADTATNVNIQSRDGDDVIAPTTVGVDGPRAADAPRPQVNIDGGKGADTVVLAGVAPENVVIQRAGDGYKITDGTGTDINLKDVEFLKGRSEDVPERASNELQNDTRGVDLDGLGLKEGEGIRLSDAQRPITDTRAMQAVAQTRANYDKSLDDILANGGYDPKLEMQSVRVSDFGPEPTREGIIAPNDVPNVRSDIEQDRGSEWSR